MAKRKAISKRTRFEVFKRDKFSCQYCGSMVPDVVLQIEHVIPVAHGGGNDILNLVAACEACNSGKGSRLLTDSDACKVQSEQMKMLADKREQLQMMCKWKNELSKLDDEIAQFLCVVWERAFGYWPIDAFQNIKKLSKVASMLDASAAIERTALMYSRKDEGECADKLLTIYRYMQQDKVRPGSSRVPFIIGILKTKGTNPYHFKEVGVLLNRLLDETDADIESVVKIAKESGSGYQFVVWLRDQFESDAGGDQ